jgi:predicted  nucleic acid-binding Zn-ribbon protein
MEVMLNQDAERLWELQSLLTELAVKERQLNIKPDSFAAVDQEYTTANDEMGRFTQTLEQLSKERRRIDGELQDQQETLKKYQGQLMQVKNQQQYAAAWKEIDSTRKQVKDLEEAELKIMGEMESAQGSLDGRQGGFDELKGRYDATYAAWQHSLGDLRGEIEQLRKRIEAAEQKIPERLRAEFYRIFKQRQNVAVAGVVNDSCGVCRVRIRPAVTQQLKRGELVFCEGCRRILHLERRSS